jgi:hypothetical protein
MDYSIYRYVPLKIDSDLKITPSMAPRGRFPVPVRMAQLPVPADSIAQRFVHNPVPTPSRDVYP